MAQHSNSKFNQLNPQSCSYCGKECKSINSVKQHERFCTLNPFRKESPFKEYNKHQVSVWNKGLTKETDDRVAIGSRKASNTLKGRKGHPHTEEYKKHMRELAIQQRLGGFNMRKAKIEYNGVKLDSSYELRVAEDLDRNSILWERPSGFSYEFNGVEHRYTPDFYLPDYNVYLDPKNDYLIHNQNPRFGYSDTEKIDKVAEQNNIKILVLDKDHLD